MPGDEEAGRLLEALRQELKENRRIMAEVQTDLRRERQETPAWVQPLVDRIENMERTLYGNGRDGLKTIVTRLTSDVENIGEGGGVHPHHSGGPSVKLVIALIAAIGTVISAIFTGLAIVIAG